MGSGYPYPVPWHLIPLNIYQNMRLVYSMLAMPRMVEMKSYLKQHGIANPLNALSLYDEDYLWLSQGMREADFPLSVIPPSVIPCGPIFLSVAPAADQDPELASWLERAPTVLINLGSIFDYDENWALEMARAVKALLGNDANVQVLWKFNKRGDYGDDFLEELKEEVANRRLRLESWIKIDPASLVETGNIALWVHHGGGNCYHEAVAYVLSVFLAQVFVKSATIADDASISTGVPQIVLPLWLDLYDYATRVEWLGIGVWGNKNSAPGLTATELTAAFEKVMGNSSEAGLRREKAEELGMLCKREPGRTKAAREIAKLARRGHP
jgi:hypothetical protein